MKYDFLTIGGATEDITVYTQDGIIIENKKDLLRPRLFAFEYGAKMKVDNAYSTFGGGAANAAVCLARFGFKVASLVAVGDDIRGRQILKNLKSRQVDCRSAQIYPGAPSGFSFLLVGPGGEHVVFSNRAANQNLSIGVREQGLIRRAKWVYLTSLSGNWQAALAGIFSAPPAQIVWDPGHIQLHSGLKGIGKYLAKTTILKINRDEALELILSQEKFRRTKPAELAKIKNLLKILKSFGPRIVVITSGQQGADAFDGQNFFRQDVIKEKKRIDTTGVGDAFGSSLAAGLEYFHGDLDKAMYLGAKNTASVIGEQGAQNGLLDKAALARIVLK